MATIINIETATHICSVALAENGKLIDYIETDDDKSHASQLAVFIDELLKKHQVKPDAVAVSKGPGSYTGLRIGVSTAKGIAYGSGIPLIAVGTLQSMAWGMINKLKTNNQTLVSEQWLKHHEFRLAPMIDARRMEVYTAFYHLNGDELTEIEASIIDENSFRQLLSHTPVLFFGNGADKCVQTIDSPNALFISGCNPSAVDMIELSHHAFQNNNFVDVAYFEPFYLKDFVAKVSVVKGL